MRNKKPKTYFYNSAISVIGALVELSRAIAEKVAQIKPDLTNYKTLANTILAIANIIRWTGKLIYLINKFFN